MNDTTVKALLFVTAAPTTIITLTATDHTEIIADALGDDILRTRNPAPGVVFWIGEQHDRHARDINVTATALLRRLLHDVLTGDYPDHQNPTPHERPLRGPELPTIFGPCVLAGAHPDGTAAPLPEAFHTWLADAVAEHDRDQAERTAVVVDLPTRAEPAAEPPF